MQHLRDAGDLRGRLRRWLRIIASDEHVDLASDLLRRSDGMKRCALYRRAVVLGNEECRLGQMTFASLSSLVTRSATSPTLAPPSCLVCSTTLSVAMRGATSTSSAAGVIVSIGFFFAFMMLGSVA